MKYYPDISIKSLCFGIFYSDCWTKRKCYKLTRTDLQIDDSDTYFSERFNKNGYVYKGRTIKVDPSIQNELVKLFSIVPSRLPLLYLPKISEPSNKDEYTVFIEVELSGGNKMTFQVDEYDARHSKLDQEVLEFKDKIKLEIKRIETYLTSTHYLYQ